MESVLARRPSGPSGFMLFGFLLRSQAGTPDQAHGVYGAASLPCHASSHSLSIW